jgi:hypothetical protein
MNDFTENELEFLKWCVRQAASHNPFKQGSTYIDGFASMIKKINEEIEDLKRHERMIKENKEENLY